VDDTPDRIVVVGAGPAGAKAALTLREEGFQGSVTLLGEEPVLPYERPPLTKEYLRGEQEAEDGEIRRAAEYEDLGVDLRVGARVAAVDVVGRDVTLADGSTLRWDRLLLATGSDAVRPDLPGATLDGVQTLRRLADARMLRDRLGGEKRLVVIGAGWIGCEAAASARQMGLDVTLIERGPAPLAGVLGVEAARVFAEAHAAEGVTLVPDAEVTAIEGETVARRVTLADGRAFEAGAVLIAVGAAPRLELARDAGLDVGTGVLVDERLRTSAEGVFAAGDIAEQMHPLLGERVRVEHHVNADAQGPAAASAMLGSDEPYDLLPFFFTDQYDLAMEYTGWAPEWDDVVVRGEPASRSVVALWLREGRVRAGMAVNVDGAMGPIEELVTSGRKVPRERLADEGVALSDL
jgi:3-phenylpropionate/trans-cinnamate dioxygenase ferredoxin reductase subunit